jgi:hypothetical protein
VGKRLGQRSGKAFEGFELVDIPGDGMFLRGVVADQAGLHGILAQIRDLGIPLLAVRRIDVDAGAHAGAGVSDEAD